MRILKIRFKNLNSLVGEWEIDLTAPAYQTHGLFAITGPTGAGKSTLLDAVCLALYGQTPRLDRVNKSQNEIMSRHTGECFSEVTFETQAGQFCAFWSHQRTRKNPEKDLQQPKHEISDANTGVVLESKIRDVAGKIKEVTGMDFKQFTRSILLAQGSFAAFLQADSDARSEILEQITGTDIYSKISVMVHERKTRERNQLDRLEAEMSGMQPLSEAEEREKEAALQLAVLSDEASRSQLDHLQGLLNWWDGIDRLEAEQRTLSGKMQEAAARAEAFLPDAQRLEKDQAALPAVADGARLEAIRTAQEKDTILMTQAEALLPERVASAAQAEDAHRLSGEALMTKRADRERFAPMIRQLRQKDVEIREAQGPLEESRKAQHTLEKTYKAHHAAMIKKEQETAQLEALKQKVSSELEATRVDESLIADLAGLEARQDQLRTQARQHREKKQEQTQMADLLLQREQALDEKRQVQQDLQLKCGVLLESYRQMGTELKDLLAGETLSQLRTDLQALDKKGQQLRETLAGTRKGLETLQLLEALAVSGERLLAQQESQLADVKETERLLAIAEQEVTRHEERAGLLRRISDLTTERAHLEAGKPCPLCGSLAHPYTERDLPEAKEAEIAEKALHGAKANRAAQMAALNRLQMDGVSLAGEAAQLEKERERLQEVFPERVVPESHALLDQLTAAQEALEHVEDTFSALEVRIREAEAIEKESARLRDALDADREESAKADSDLLTAVNAVTESRNLLARLTRENDLFEKELEEGSLKLHDLVAPFFDAIEAGTDATTDGKKDLRWEERLLRLDEWMPALADRRAKRLERQEQAHRCAQQLAVAVQQQTQMSVEAKRLETETGALAQRMDLQEKRLVNLETERQALLDHWRSASPDAPLPTADDIEHILQQEEKAAQEAETLSAAQAVEQRRMVEQLQNSLTERKQAMGQRAEELRTLEGAFLKQLQSLGFSGESQWKEALLEEKERAALQVHASALEKETHAISEQMANVANQWTAEKDRALTTETREALLTAKVEETERRSVLQQQMGALRQELSRNRELRTRMAEQLAHMLAQRRECERWDGLHALIGSADGKKYRTFAQGLTFEMMVRHANHQLARLTDRYLLVRDVAEPLELLVIDNYQAGETRSTKNLSGGESFLVSLSLALGLSRMASRKVRVDSLFLDEGFGTLDEETLSSALDTLAGLQRDGKLIGVISHVNALKERIPTQIQVTPEANGRSVLTGHGCRQL